MSSKVLCVIVQDKKREEKKKAKLDKSTLDDPFGEDAEEDEHLKALAQQLEEKYVSY